MENRLVPVQSRLIHFNMNLHLVGSKDQASGKYNSVQSHHKVKTYVRCGHTGALPLPNQTPKYPIWAYMIFE